MMRHLILSIFVFFTFALNADANVYIQYINKDSKTYTFDVKIGKKMKTVEFGGNRTTSLIIEGGENVCIIYTSCGEIKLTNKSRITITNGCITID